MDEAELIRVVQFPNLYNKKHSLFKDKMARENSWKTISRLMNDHQQHEMFSAVDVEKRWTSLQQKYSQQKKDIRTMPSGSGGGVKVKRSGNYQKAGTDGSQQNVPKDVTPLADLWEPLPELWDSLGTITSDKVATTKESEQEKENNEATVEVVTVPVPGTSNDAIRQQTGTLRRQMASKRKRPVNALEESTIRYLNNLNTFLEKQSGSHGRDETFKTAIGDLIEGIHFKIDIDEDALFEEFVALQDFVKNGSLNENEDVDQRWFFNQRTNKKADKENFKEHTLGSKKEPLKSQRLEIITIKLDNTKSKLKKTSKELNETRKKLREANTEIKL
ncbi:unnamed protein product [Brassicogethes aeneus]|uniref:MADF domain-containing protein n=1 Tax=Brassicogethes aeneus TaxID=1431903 RepID=A0A9P0FP86_BRAAE|nr:unnamed protein product [Brassicogethes aeneus]